MATVLSRTFCWLIVCKTFQYQSHGMICECKMTRRSAERPWKRDLWIAVNMNGAEQKWIGAVREGTKLVCCVFACNLIFALVLTYIVVLEFKYSGAQFEKVVQPFNESPTLSMMASVNMKKIRHMVRISSWEHKKMNKKMLHWMQNDLAIAVPSSLSSAATC